MAVLWFLINGRDCMALPRTIQTLLASAAKTSTIDDIALDDLGRRVLEAVILDPDIPKHIKDAAATRLADAPSSPAARPPDESSG